MRFGKVITLSAMGTAMIGAAYAYSSDGNGHIRCSDGLGVTAVKQADGSWQAGGKFATEHQAATALCADHSGASAAQTWWVAKSKGGVYTPPNRPLWKLSDLKKMHAGQANWREPVVKDAQHELTYNSAAPGTKFGVRMNSDTPTLFVVTGGEIHFDVEGQKPITAKRGAIVNILRSTSFSFDVTGTQNALWLEVNAPGFRTLYPTSEAAPKPGPGLAMVQVKFNHTPPAYAGINRLMVNTYDVMANCNAAQGNGVAVADEARLNVVLSIGYLNPKDNPCGTGQRNIGDYPDKPGAPPYDSHAPFSHMHPRESELWVDMVGDATGKVENVGEFHATEGDLINAATNSWHDVSDATPKGPSVRLVIFTDTTFNMRTTAEAK